MESSSETAEDAGVHDISMESATDLEASRTENPCTLQAVRVGQSSTDEIPVGNSTTEDGVQADILMESAFDQEALGTENTPCTLPAIRAGQPSTDEIPERNATADEDKIHQDVQMKSTTDDQKIIAENMRLLRSVTRNRQLSEKICECNVTASESHQIESSRPEAGVALTNQATVARKTWEMSNHIQQINATDDIFKYNREQQEHILRAKPWSKDPHFFQNIKVSALALLKMVMHARSGGNIEVMGLLLGKLDGYTMVVMDAFALPVEGTETRVNAHAEAYEYMTTYIEAARQVGRLENAIGWYHSHPGYGCWLSGIDVSTQLVHQTYEEPFVAIVIDPVRTISAGKVCIGAFRTYPKDYAPPNVEASEYQTIPLHKIEDFGVHCNRYYSLNISYFKSSLDCHLLELLWNKFWVNTLSSSNLITNRDYLTGQIRDISEKLKPFETRMNQCTIYVRGDVNSQEKKDTELLKATKDSIKITTEMLNGLMAQTIKDRLFNNVSSRTPSSRNNADKME